MSKKCGPAPSSNAEKKRQRQRRNRRGQSLMKKAYELSALCNADVCLGIRMREIPAESRHSVPTTPGSGQRLRTWYCILTPSPKIQTNFTRTRAIQSPKENLPMISFLMPETQQRRKSSNIERHAKLLFRCIRLFYLFK